MRLRQLTFNPYQENTYLLIGEGGEAWILDPGFASAAERELFHAVVQEEGAQPVGIYLTHAHIDHILGVAWAAQRYKVPLFFHAAEQVVYDHAEEWATLMGLGYTPGPPAHAYLSEGQKLRLGSCEIEVLFVPGHSPGHVAFYLPQQKWVLSGDVLFRGSIGNYLLPLADYEALMHSLHQKLLRLPPDTTVWPGHGEPTTIEQELRSNPFLASV
mgnify:CR=1 FL=1